MVYWIVPPLQSKMEQVATIRLGTYPTVVCPFHGGYSVRILAVGALSRNTVAQSGSQRTMYVDAALHFESLRPR